MNFERLAYLSLKEVVKQPSKEGELNLIFQKMKIPLSDSEVQLVGEFIKTNYLAHVMPSIGGNIDILANLTTEQFVQRHNEMTLDDKVKLICSELRSLPERQGELEKILRDLRIDYTIHDLPDFLDYFKRTGFARNLTERSKDGAILYLTDRGVDYLNGKYTNLTSVPSTTIYNVNGGQIAALGSNATAYHNTFNQINHLPADFDYDALLQELTRLRIALASSSDRENHKITGEVAYAEEAAEARDGSKVIEHLKRGGKLLWSFSENVGANMVANILAGQIPM